MAMARVASVLLTACIALGAHAQEAAGVTAKTVTIGAWMPLTGATAIYGVPLKAGTEAYFKLVNDRGGVNGRKINWIVEDNNYSTQQTVSIARKLISRDHVMAIVNTHGTASTAATFPYVLDTENVPILSAYGGAIDWYTPPKRNLLGALALYEDQGRFVGKWAAEEGHKKILVIQHSGLAFDNVADSVDIGIRSVSKDIKIERLSIKMGTADYAPIALQVAQMKPDAIITLQIQQELAALARDLKRQGNAVQMYVYSPTLVNSIIDLGGKDIEGLKAVSLSVSPFDDTPAVKEYRDALAKYSPGEKPDFPSLWTFGMAKIFVEALSRAKEPLSGKAVVDAYYTLKDYDTGIFPPATFTAAAPLGISKMRRMQLVNGKWQTVGPWVEPPPAK